MKRSFRNVEVLVTALALLSFAANADRTSDDLTPQSEKKGPSRATYTRDVAPILNAKCVNCHRPDEIAPMSLRTYEEVRPCAKSIQKKWQRS